MKNVRLTSKQTHARIKARTKEIRIDGTYFLSSFLDKEGAWVTVTSASTKQNMCGWPSSVEYAVIEPVGIDGHQQFYAKGETGTCNATNLYERRADASPAAKRAAALNA